MLTGEEGDVEESGVKPLDAPTIADLLDGNANGSYAEDTNRF